MGKINFKLDMKAVYVKYFQEGRKKIISKASISYTDNVFVLQITSNHPSDVNRLIYDKNFDLLYSMNLESQECSIEYVPPMTSGKQNFPGLRWPQFEDLFNLLNLDLWAAEHKETKLLKTHELNGKNYTVFERLISNFYAGPRNSKAKATYHFKSNEERKSLVRISIGPMDNEFSFYEPEIQLTIANYTEDPEDDYDCFDLSTCYKNPGSYRWVQFTIDNIPPKVGMDYKKMELIFRGALHKSLSIPRIRIGQVGINLWVPKVYIAAQLIEHPDFQFLYSIIAEKRLRQATQIYKLESIKDCADICIDSNKACSFSYCEDRKCHIRIFGDKRELHRKTDLVDEKLCQTFQSLRKFDTQPGYEHRLSTRALITNIIERKGEIIFEGKNGGVKDPNMTINAINGPDDLMGPYLDSPFVFLGDQFHVTKRGYKIREPILETIADQTYRRCLDACNDREDCQSFSHCSNNICIISSVQDIGDDPDAIEIDAKCSISTRLYINRFERISDRKIERNPEKTYLSVTREKCAEICSVDERDCVSFDYCESFKEDGNQRSCLLHNGHDMHRKVKRKSTMNEEDESLICSHYSKKVSKDFVQNYGTRFNSDINLQSKDEFQSQESCAYECLGSKCVAFEFCHKLDKNNQLPEFGCRIFNVEAGKSDKLSKLESLIAYKDCSTFLHKNLFKLEKKKLHESSSLHFSFFISLIAILAALGLTIFFLISRRRNQIRHTETAL